MILHDRVEVWKPGGYSQTGDPLPPELVGTYPAEVRPLTVEELAIYDNAATDVRQKVILPPVDLTIGTDWTIKYDGEDWQLEGVAVPHKANGRTHHLEMVIVS